MSTIAEFLLARITEDGAFARRAQRAYQHVLGIPHYFDPTPGEFPSPMVAMNPRVALAECEAKRRIVELHVPKHGECNVCFDRHLTLAGDYVFEDWPCPTLRSLALPYADHPDYDPAWSPDPEVSRP